MNQRHLRVSHHLLLCATSNKGACCENELGEATWSRLKKVLKQEDLENPNRTKGLILRSKVDCLRICIGGPILLVWPEGIWYGSVTPERIEVIVHEHIIQGKPLEEWIIRRSKMTSISIGERVNN